MKLNLTQHGFPGKLIVIEGQDGSGKTTIERRIVTNFASRGIEMLVTQQPSVWFRTSDRVLATLFGDGDGDIIADEAVALFALADRLDHQRKLLEPHLARGAIVLCNRYVYALFSYYMAMQTVDLTWLGKVASHVLRPDLAILLNANAMTLVDRVIQKDGRNTNYYDQNEKIVHRIMDGYLELAQANDIHVVDTSGDEDASFQLCDRLVELALSSRES